MTNTPTVHTVDLSTFQVGRANGLWTCLIQLPQRSRDDIAANRNNPAGLSVLEQLMHEGPGGVSKLTENAQATQTSLVLFPEFAFGSGDWQQIDNLVRNFSRSLVIIATFGASPLAAISEIEDAARASGTAMHKGWQAALSGDRLINFGSVWVKNTTTQACVLFGKRYAQQKVEAIDFDIVEFPQSTAIKLHDLWLMPSICADLIKRTGEGGMVSVTSEMVGHLQQDDRAALITASLLQPTGQTTAVWTASIGGLAYSLGGRNAAVLICNVSTVSPDNKDGAEKWRNLTGIYLSRNFLSNDYEENESFVFHAEDNVFGWTARSWYAQIMLGTLRLPPYATTTHYHPWVGYRRFEVSDGLPPYSRTPIEEDLLLYCYASGLGDRAKHTLLSNVRDHINSGATPQSIKLASEFLQGPFFAGRLATGPLLQVDTENMRFCLQGADALLNSSGKYIPTVDVSWQSQGARHGQLTIDTRSVALWASNNLRRDQMLEKLRDDTESVALHETLTIFGQGKEDLGLIQSIWEELCRDRTEDVNEDNEPFSDLPTTSVPRRSDYIRVREFGHIKRLVISEHETDPEEKQLAFDNIINMCKGTPT